MKKITAILLAIMVAVFAQFSATAEADTLLYVGGKLVTAENQDDVFGDGKVKYVPQSHTLYLNEATISTANIIEGIVRRPTSYSSNADAALMSIYAEGDLSIRLTGKNIIAIFGSSQVDDTWYGIYCGGTLSITGSDPQTDELLVTTCDPDGLVRAKYAGGLFACGDLYASACSIQCGCRDAADDYSDSTQCGVYSTGELELQSALLVGYTANQELASNSRGVTIGGIDGSNFIMLAFSGNKALDFGVMGRDAWENTAHVGLFSTMQASVNYDGSDATDTSLNNFTMGKGADAKYVIIQRLNQQ